MNNPDEQKRKRTSGGVSFWVTRQARWFDLKDGEPVDIISFDINIQSEEGSPIDGKAFVLDFLTLLEKHGLEYEGTIEAINIAGSQ